jgi:hypothetical protein
VPGQIAYRFTSPRLKQEDTILRECPVGKILSETPHLYEAINATAHVSGSGVAFLSSPMWFQQVASLVAYEKARLGEMANRDAQAKRDAERAKRALGISRHG